ncbi:MAG TPA: hypothetical protein VGH98_06015 [Gemmatimonadaceae bacterium]|jgi:uncharacterized repeat protein (TIGR01451 family)
MIRPRLHSTFICVVRRLAFGALLACVPASLRAQETISSAANQLFHVADATTTASSITVTDVGGGNIKFNRDIHITIPTGFNMQWDTSVPTVTITGSASGQVSTTVSYTGTATVVINVTGTFAANDFVVISGLKFTNFTATSTANNLQLALKNSLQVEATDAHTIQIDPHYDVAVTPASTSLTSLPTNGGSLTATFTVTNSGAVSDSYDLLTSKNPGTALSVVSITGTSITQGANPDSARRAALASLGTVTVTVTYRIGNVANGTIDTLKLTGRSVGNNAKTSTGVLIVTVIRPVISIGKAVNPGGTQMPGTNLTFTSTVTNVGGASAASLAVVDSIPTSVQYKLASASATLPVGVTVVIEYSNDAGITWTYVPFSTGCSAPVGYDRCVNRIRWRLQAALSSTAPNNQGTLSFISRIR